jgi:hypothetical protein
LNGLALPLELDEGRRRQFQPEHGLSSLMARTPALAR